MYLEKKEGPCVIVAGAGTGKTHTIVEKIKYLLKNNVYKPSEIVAITFSNEAASSLKNRVLAVCSTDEPIIKTIHSFCADLLRKEGSILQVSDTFRLLLPEDAIVLLHTNLKVAPQLCHTYVQAIGVAKDLGISYESFSEHLNKQLREAPEELEKELEDLQFKRGTAYLKEAKGDKQETADKIAHYKILLQRKKFLAAWRAYEKIKEKRNALDYGDLNNLALELLRKRSELTEAYKYIIVDEFQDTNKSQLELLTLLAPHHNIMIVGDLNQSIYRFRGAYKDNFTEFKKLFNVQDNEVYNLTKSYRSPNTILQVAHELIEHNYEEKDTCFKVESAHGIDGLPVEVYELNNGQEEVRKIVESIAEAKSQGMHDEEICIIFRTHQQANSLKKILAEHGIPYTSASQKSLLKNKIIQQTINYLIVLQKIKAKHAGGEHAWWELVHTLNLSKEDAVLVGKFLKENRNDDCISIRMLNALEKLYISPVGKKKVEALLLRVKSLIPSMNKPIPEIIVDIYRSLATEEATGTESVIALETFHEKIKEWVEKEAMDIPRILEYIDILKTLEIDIPIPLLEQKGIRLMTAHATKGLEYELVILTALAQKKFPLERAERESLIPSELAKEWKIDGLSSEELKEKIKEYEKEHQLREERRLCYVACTRAKKKLILMYAKKYSTREFEPSQFLVEMNYKKNPVIKFIEDTDEKYALISAEENKEGKEDITSVISEKSLTFSPSSLVTFMECPKKYEYRYVYNMPEEETISWDAMRLGSFVHAIMEIGVQENFSTLHQYSTYAKELHEKPEWNTVELSEALPLITIFFERNKNKYNQLSRTEEFLTTRIDGIKFQGFADRIDFHEDGLEIIDYKTGASAISPTARNWQLGFYALACKKFGKVKRVTLDMLKHDRPLEFDLDNEGNAIERNAKRMTFNLGIVQEELVTTAKQIIDCYKKGFKPCPIDKNCDFCNEHIRKT